MEQALLFNPRFNAADIDVLTDGAGRGAGAVPGPSARNDPPHRIAIEHPEPETNNPGCTAAFARHGYLIVARTRNHSLYRLKA
ncbi:MAG: hypothetical protein AAF566_10910 [Pseudomonadota bacterium]